MLFFNNSNAKFFKIESQLSVYWYKYLFVYLFSDLGAHLGHTKLNTKRQAAWMLYGFKWNLAIINLSLTVISIKSGFSLVTGCAAKVRPFWFVTQDKSFYKYSRYLAFKCGEFSSTFYWIRGMASNYSEITTTFFTRKPSFVFMRKDDFFDFNFNDWFFTRLTWPGGMLISSVFFSKFATKDSFKGFVGCVGLLDTNALADYCLLAVPSNDDSVDWVVFVNDIFSEYILLKKLWAVLRWHYFLLKKPSLFSFFEKWVHVKSNKFLQFNRFFFSKKISKYNLFFFPLWFISSYNAGFFPILEKMDVLHTGVDVVFSKNILKNIFNNLLVKRKMLLGFLTHSFFGRSFFFLADLSENILGLSNWEAHSFFKFNYFLYNRWFLSNKISPFIRKFQRNDFFYFFYLNNISFLSSFGTFFAYQRFSFFFRQNFYNNNNWWEKIYYLFFFFSFFFDWNLSLQKIKRATKTTKFISSYFSARRFFLVDPVNLDFYYRKVRIEKRFFFFSSNKCHHLFTRPFRNFFFLL